MCSSDLTISCDYVVIKSCAFPLSMCLGPAADYELLSSRHTGCDVLGYTAWIHYQHPKAEPVVH